MGQLVKARIIAKEAEIDLAVMFNPAELRIEKSVSWVPAKVQRENPGQEFKQPQSSVLMVTLHFDGYESKRDVYQSSVSEIEKAVTIVPKIGRPPLTDFVWGRFAFRGVVESLSQRYTLFLEDGSRVRCEVGLRMRSADQAISHPRVAEKSDTVRDNGFGVGDADGQ